MLLKKRIRLGYIITTGLACFVTVLGIFIYSFQTKDEPLQAYNILLFYIDMQEAIKILFTNSSDLSSLLDNFNLYHPEYAINIKPTYQDYLYFLIQSIDIKFAGASFKYGFTIDFERLNLLFYPDYAKDTALLKEFSSKIINLLFENKLDPRFISLLYETLAKHSLISEQYSEALSQLSKLR